MKTCNDCVGCESDERDGKIACEKFILRKEDAMEICCVSCKHVKCGVFKFPCVMCNNGESWESKEGNSVKEDMKLIYKQPMTEAEQRKEFDKLLHSFDTGELTTSETLDKAMQIAKNDSKIIEGVEFKIESGGGKMYSTNLGNAYVTLSVEQIEKAYLLIHGGENL